MMAMIKLWKSDRLRKLGWKLLLQIHDEVILEGPVEHKEEVNGLFIVNRVSPYFSNYPGYEGGSGVHGEPFRRPRT